MTKKKSSSTEKVMVHMNQLSELCVIAKQDIRQGESIIEFDSDGFYLSKPNKYTIQITPDKHLMHPIGMYINHSFTPNSKPIFLELIAIKDISKGEEITFDYKENEDSIVNPFIDKKTNKEVK